jgi:uncharacterized membrane protein
MDPALVNLTAASVAFVGTHFAMSHPLRGGLVRALGEKGFAGVYSLVSLATFGWMIWAFRRVPPFGRNLWSGYDEVSWTLSSLLTIAALVLFLGSLRGNPAFPGVVMHPEGEQPASKGVFAVTRHPMMWGFALWALSHIMIAPTGRTLIVGLAIGFLALVGSHLQDRKKQALLGERWRAWEAKTHFWPRWRHLPRAGLFLWVIALVLWLAITWAHIPTAYVPAGIWRWVG